MYRWMYSTNTISYILNRPRCEHLTLSGLYSVLSNWPRCLYFGATMNTNKNPRIEQIIQLINAHAHSKGYTTKGEHMAAEIGYLVGWLASIAESDWTVRQELQSRLEQLGVTEARSIVMNKRRGQ
jgi:hypothetical protein